MTQPSSARTVRAGDCAATTVASLIGKKTGDQTADKPDAPAALRCRRTRHSVTRCEKHCLRGFSGFRTAWRRCAIGRAHPRLRLANHRNRSGHPTGADHRLDRNTRCRMSIRCNCCPRSFTSKPKRPPSMPLRLSESTTFLRNATTWSLVHVTELVALALDDGQGAAGVAWTTAAARSGNRSGRWWCRRIGRSERLRVGP